MNPDRILARIHALLAEERAAISALDSAAVHELATEKEALFQQLIGIDRTTQPDLATKLKPIVAELRANGILLAHARDCLQDAVAIVSRRTTRLSVRG